MTVFPREISKDRTYVFNKQNIAKKLDPTLKPSHVPGRGNNVFHSFMRTKVQTSTQLDPEVFAHVFYMPISSLDLRVFFCFVLFACFIYFLPNMFGLRWPSSSKKGN